MSKEYYCTKEELNQNNVVYSINFNAKQPYIKILAYQNCVVICTSKELQAKVKEILQHKNRDEIFEFPFIYGQTIHYIPDDKDINDNILVGYTYDSFFDKDIFQLKGLVGFENSLVFDDRGFTSTRAICTARYHNNIIGVAGATVSSVNEVWEIGIDVVKEHRNKGVGTYLVKKLTKELLKQNIVPYYSASVTNIASQMVANRCYYIPFWVDTFGTVLDGSSVYNDIVEKLKLI